MPTDYKNCVKCGYTGQQRPTFVNDHRGERLVRKCLRCGYETSGPCEDAAVATPMRAWVQTGGGGHWPAASRPTEETDG